VKLSVSFLEYPWTPCRKGTVWPLQRRWGRHNWYGKVCSLTRGKITR
jgi:hypothetical protein